jgi:hypothetical protein
MTEFSCVGETVFELPRDLMDRVQAEILAGKLVDAPPYWTNLRNFVGDFTVKDPNDTEMLAKAPRIKQRWDEAEEHWGLPISKLRQNLLSNSVTQAISDSLPDYIHALQPRICIQTVDSGNTTPPHKDNSRTCSLFYLFDSNNAETVWWQYKPEWDRLKHKVPEDYELSLYPRISLIVPKHKEVLKEHTWYVFDTKEIHSVHSSNAAGQRVTLCLEFAKTPAKYLYRLINEHQQAY